MYSRQDCVVALQKAAEHLGKSPSVREYRDLEMSPHYRTIQEKFGSWNEAKQAANLVSFSPKHERVASFYTTKNGYEIASTKVDGEQELVKIHRLVAVAEYGYDAVVDNDVHHKNNVPWDNRSENLEPLSRSEHMVLHKGANQSTNSQL